MGVYYANFLEASSQKPQAQNRSTLTHFAIDTPTGNDTIRAPRQPW